MFSCDPHNVPQVPNSFPKTFPITPHFSVLFGHGSTSMHISCKEERFGGWAQKQKHDKEKLLYVPKILLIGQ
jgi:hypothetical protein